MPAPGAESTTADPPTRSSRASMLWAMPRRSGATSARRKPTPRSRTNTSAMPSRTSANTETSPISPCLAALTHASRVAAASASTASPNGASPTTTVSTFTWYAASTSRTVRPSAVTSVSAAEAAPTVGLPATTTGPYSHSRSSRSCWRASTTVRRGSSAVRWMRASVCSTESWRCAAIASRSCARIRSRRSAAASCARRASHGPTRTETPSSVSAVATAPTRTLLGAPSRAPTRSRPKATSAAPAISRPRAQRPHRLSTSGLPASACQGRSPTSGRTTPITTSPAATTTAGTITASPSHSPVERTTSSVPSATHVTATVRWTSGRS